LDQRLEDRFVDLPQSHHAQMESKRVEDPNVWGAMAMAQASEAAPGRLFGKHPGQQIERMHRREQRQQMRAPELGRAEVPARAARRTEVPLCVDEVVGNVWIEQIEQTAGTGNRKAVHGAEGYPFEHDASGFCSNSQFFFSSHSRRTSYAETCNTL
jgi:hypothetical protein